MKNKRQKTHNKRIKKGRGMGGLMWIISFLLCINVAPLANGAKKKRATPTPTSNIPDKKNIKKQPTKPSTKPSIKRGKAKNNPQKKSIIHFRSKNLPRFGRFFLGKIIGPRWIYKRVRCYRCKKQIVVKNLLAVWHARRYDSDLRPFYGHYHQKDRIWFCHHCSYAAYAKDFYLSYSKSRMTLAITPIHKHLQKKDYSPTMARFHAAAAAYWARKKNSRFFGKLFVRAVWAAREEREYKELHLFRQRAIAAITIAFRNNEYSDKERASTAYLLADLLRQEGKFHKALFWLEKSLNILELQKKKKVKGVHFARYLEAWIFQLQIQISKKNKRVFVLD